MTPPSRPAVAALLAAGLALTACGDEADAPVAASAPTPAPATASATAAPTAAAMDQESSEASERPAMVPVVPAEAGHLHGIGVDPGDGRVLLGTHAGLMAVGAEGVERVGDATTDLMGFAVAGPQHYYASGHPGPGEDLPNPVGLIETTDGGLTWTSLSLAGRSDFHALTAGAGRVYGYDGMLRSSSDGVDWQDGALDVAPASLAVHPDQPGTVVATTQDGPVRSQDGGATFAALAGAPLLVLVAWASPDALWGVTPDGEVLVSADSGDGWEPRGQVGGPPEAFSAAADGTVLVATAAHVLRSEDGGRTFVPVAARE